MRVTEDKERVLADLLVSGTIEDALSNLRPGDAGIIDALHVRLNGEPAHVLEGSDPVVIDVSYTKASGGGSGGAGSLLTPYEYSGTFATVIEGLEIQPGWNTVQLLAQNSAGYTGFSERAFELRPNPPPDSEVDIRLEFYTDDLVLVTLTVQNDDDFHYLKEPFEQIAPGVYEHINTLGTIIMPADLNPDTDEDFLAEVTLESFDLSQTLIWVEGSDPNAPIFEGSTLLEEAHRPDWTGYVFELDPVTDISASEGGAFEPFLIEVLGPNELSSSILDVEFVSLFENAENEEIAWGRTYNVLLHNDRHFLALEGNEFPEVMLALPSTIEGELLGGPVGEWREGAWEFTKGFGAGFVDTGVDLVDSIGAVGKLGWHTIKNYHTISIIWRLQQGGEIILEEDEQRIMATAEFTVTLGTLAWDLHQGSEALVYAILAGDAEPLNALSEDQRKAFEVVIEMFDAVKEAALDMDEHDLGRIYGRIVSEVALTVGTAGTGVALKSATGVTVINKLMSLPVIPAAVKTTLANKLPHYEALALALGKEGENVASILRRLEDIEDVRGIEKLQRMLDVTNTEGARKAVDGSMRPVMSGIMKEAYTDAVQLADVPTVAQLKSLKNSAAYSPRLKNKDLAVHHTVPKYLLRRILELMHPNWTESQYIAAMNQLQDTMPGMLLHKKDHVGVDAEGLESFHRHLSKHIPPGAQHGVDDIQTIFDALHQSYTDWDQPEVWQWSFQWLTQEVLNP